MNNAHLGILVRYSSSTKHPPFMEEMYYKKLSKHGIKQGIKVTVFSPLYVDWGKKRVLGYRYNKQTKAWKKAYYPFPNVLYDRIAYTDRRQIQEYHPEIKRFIVENNAILLARGLPGKWVVYNMIKDIRDIQPYLPETEYFHSKMDWLSMLKKYSSIVFKPASGSHGRGVFRVWIENQQIKIQGRNGANTLFHKSFSTIMMAHRWILHFIGRRTYVVQPYLELSTVNNHPFDLRILVQKNKQGIWTETGRAVRVGKKASLTSNLDGGGIAVDAHKFLANYYTQNQIAQINKDIETIIAHIPNKLEERHGPLFELGIDVGIDREGHVWILEVNSKPGRESFKLAHNYKAYESAILAPIYYTDYVVSQHGGSKIS